MARSRKRTLRPSTARRTRHSSRVDRACLDDRIRAEVLGWIEERARLNGPHVPDRLALFETDSTLTCAELVDYLIPTSQTHGSLVFVSVLVLLRRLERKCPGIVTTATSVRLLATLTTVAAKVEFDHAPRNKWWAVACGLEVADLNQLERAVLKIMDYQVIVAPADIDRVLPDLSSDLGLLERSLGRCTRP